MEKVEEREREKSAGMGKRKFTKSSSLKVLSPPCSSLGEFKLREWCDLFHVINLF